MQELGAPPRQTEVQVWDGMERCYPELSVGTHPCGNEASVRQGGPVTHHPAGVVQDSHLSGVEALAALTWPGRAEAWWWASGSARHSCAVGPGQMFLSWTILRGC